MKKKIRNGNRKFRLPMTIKLFSNGKMVYAATFHKKTKILRSIQVHLWDKAYIKFSYGDGFYNDGIYENLNDLMQAFSVFTEKVLLDFTKGKETNGRN